VFELLLSYVAESCQREEDEEEEEAAAAIEVKTSRAAIKAA
jgi:hypothetical protein